MKLKSISIHALRGINQLDLDLEGKSMLICGENGTGKSSIVDAIEFFFRNKISHLDGTQGLSVKDHGTHARASAKEVKVSVVIDPGSILLTRTFKIKPQAPNELEEAFKLAEGGTFILRRSQILEFIHTTPAERFRAIGKILGTELLDANEASFMKARDHFAGLVKRAESSKAEMLQAVSTSLGYDVNDHLEILSKLNDKLAEYGHKPLQSFEEVKEYEKKLLKGIRHSTDSTKIANLHSLLKRISTMFLEPLGEVVKTLKMEGEKIAEKNIEKKLSSMNLLSEGQYLLEDENVQDCPLCLQSIDRDSLLQSVGRRLKTLESLSQEASAFRVRCLEIQKNLSLKNSTLKAILEMLEVLDSDSSEISNLKEINTRLTDFIDNLEKVKNLSSRLDIESFDKITLQLRESLTVVETRLRASLEDSELTEKEQQLLESVRLIELANTKFTELGQNRQELDSHRNRFDIASQLYHAYSETKKLKIQEIHNSMQEEIQKFYSHIHPKEDHRDIKLIVNESKRASTAIRVQSYGKEVDPRAYESEGHLDSLGICIFLAFVKRFNADLGLVVLDDIVTTIDSRHRIRICELIYENFPDYQLIITTHDYIWNEQLIAQQRRFKIQHRFINLNIDEWDIVRGIIIRPYKPRKERIESNLSVGDRNASGNGIRQYLEALLKDICHDLEAPVPFKKEGRYSVGDLIDPSRKRIEKLVKDCQWKSDIVRKYDDIAGMSIYANILSHDNSDLEALNISIDEIRDFYMAVQELEEMLLCPNCKENLQYNRQTRELRCSNHRCTNKMVLATQ